MNIHIGLKSDPIEHRFSFDWLFGLLNELDVRYMQMGSYPELYYLEDGFFHDLRKKAEKKNILIKSCFTTHRELGGFLTGDRYMEKAARRIYERLIHVASLIGAESTGVNSGSIYRDRMEYKEKSIELYLAHMKKLMSLAGKKGLKALNIEPMSCLAEPPTLPEEINLFMQSLGEHHRNHIETTVPVYLCPDISHGYADQDGNVVYDNWSLFEYAIPYTAEFHLKNTNSIFEETFGFSQAEMERGIVDLQRLKRLIEENADRFPVVDLVGYLEIGGPKLGRDYSDRMLEKIIADSLTSLKNVF